VVLGNLGILTREKKQLEEAIMRMGERAGGEKGTSGYVWICGSSVAGYLSINAGKQPASALPGRAGSG
jgi:hypothetical protein